MLAECLIHALETLLALTECQTVAHVVVPMHLGFPRVAQLHLVAKLRFVFIFIRRPQRLNNADICVLCLSENPALALGRGAYLLEARSLQEGSVPR